jgi:N-acetylneuraminic acid mutarotase
LRSTDGITFSGMPDLPVAMRGTQLVVYQQDLWLLGGRDQSDNNRSQVWRSQDGGNNWAEVGNLIEPRAYGSAFVHQERLWYVGGWNTAAESDVWSTTDGNNWTIHNPLPNARYFIAGAVHEEQMWMLGGSSNGDDGVTDVLRTTNAMSFVTAVSLPGANASGSALSWRGSLWIAGGGTNLVGPGPAQAYSQVHTMLPNGTWDAVGALPGGRFYGAMVIFSP